jgi:hypothetical protein
MINKLYADLFLYKHSGEEDSSLYEAPCLSCGKSKTLRVNSPDHEPGKSSWTCDYVCTTCKSRFWMTWSLEGRPFTSLCTSMGEGHRGQGKTS